MEYKNYLIEDIGTFAMKTIKPTGRGSVHKSLRGNYTSTQEAIKAIDFYEENKAKRSGVEDGETSSSG